MFIFKTLAVVVIGGSFVCVWALILNALLGDWFNGLLEEALES